MHAGPKCLYPHCFCRRGREFSRNDCILASRRPCFLLRVLSRRISYAASPRSDLFPIEQLEHTMGRDVVEADTQSETAGATPPPISDPNARPDVFTSTLQECLCLLSCTLAVAMTSFLTGGVTVMSSFAARELNMVSRFLKDNLPTTLD